MIAFTQAKGIRINETTTKMAKNIIISNKYQITKRKEFSLIKFWDFLMNSANGINGITIQLNGTIAEMNAP